VDKDWAILDEEWVIFLKIRASAKSPFRKTARTPLTFHKKHINDKNIKNKMPPKKQGPAANGRSRLSSAEEKRLTS
jgi:hypothetical protein